MKKGGTFMLTQQDVAMLSDLLNRSLQPIKADLQQLHKDFIGLNNKFNGLRQDMNEKIDGLREEMRAEIRRLDEKIDAKIDGLREEMHAEIRRLDAKIDVLREEMHAEIDRLDGKIDKTQRDIDEIKTILHTDISPRLKTIEDCYLKTFERYYEGAERQKKMEEDISVMKDVIQEHSAQLQKLCS